MKCKNCVLSWIDEGKEYPSCHADPNWPAPCEYDDDDYEEDNSDWGKSEEYYY